jgi:hypothetical protein
MSQIRAASKTNFNLNLAEVVRLTKAGVPETVIETMRNPKRAPAASAPAQQPNPAPANPAPVAPPVTVASAPVIATPTAPAAAPTPPPAAVRVESVTLVDGWPVPVTLAEDIPQDAEAGRALHFTVTKDVRVGDAVVIAQGASVTGEIAEGAKKKLFGGTKMTLRMLSIDAVDGKKYRVRALSARAGDGKTERPVETTTKPKSKDLAASAGTAYIAYIDGDVTVVVRK